MSRNLIVAGGGAAGFFCAVTAARLQPRLNVVILEKSSKLLSKVRISGGGRCNVTHSCFSIAEMVRNYPRGRNFLKSAFHHFFTSDTVNWFRERGIQLKAEADGRMFPVTDSSETIIECLTAEAARYGVTVRCNSGVRRIEPAASPDASFTVHLDNGEDIQADYVCIAAGGFPKQSQYGWLGNLGHGIASPVPSLFTFNIPDGGFSDLMGISLESARIKLQGLPFVQEGPLLITHWGLSGPAVLKLSAYAARELAALNYRFSISVNWLGSTNETELAARFHVLRQDFARRKIRNRNPFNLPARLWDYMLSKSGIDGDRNWADLPGRQQNALIKNLCAQELQINGKTTFKEEFVTAGGIQLSEVTSSTMESKLIPNLFFAGEILDVDGITGGFNFQHAWSSGFIAGKTIANRLPE